MDAQGASSTSGWKPTSTSSRGRGEVTSSASSSMLHPLHRSPAGKSTASLASSEYSSMESQNPSDLLSTGRDIAPYEAAICERLTKQIRAISVMKSEVDASLNLVSTSRPLEEALRDVARTIRYNAKWFPEQPLARLLETALSAAASSSASADIHAAISLIDVVNTYSLLPQSCLEQCVCFITQTYYGSTRAYKTKKLADAIWTTLHDILESHLGGQCVVALLRTVDCRDETFLESKVGYAQIAGALMIISEKMLLPNVRNIPTPGLPQLLDNLWGTARNGTDNLRECIMDILCVILTNEHAIHELDAQSSWNILLETVEPCVTLTPSSKAARSVVESLLLHLDHFESRSLPTIAHLFVDVDLPLPSSLADSLVEPYMDIFPTGDMPNALRILLEQLCRSTAYTPQLTALIDIFMVKLSIRTPEREAFDIFLGMLGHLSIDQATTTEAGAILAKALIQIFLRNVRSKGNVWEQQKLFDVLCIMSARSIDAAKFLFDIRADAEGALYIRNEVAVQAAAFSDHSSTGGNHLDGVSSLTVQRWHDTILDVLSSSARWELYSCYLTALPSLLSNHSMFIGRLGFVVNIRAVICDLLERGNYLGPPEVSTLTKPITTVALLQVLTAVLSYHRQLGKQDILKVISIFLGIAGSRDHAVSIQCVHALTICCYELPELMSSYMDDIVDKMSKMVTQRYLAIHVLLFLAGLSRLPELFRNFQMHDYKKIFGVCGSYLQSIRGTSAMTERQQTPSSDQSSRISAESPDALPQYVYALAHHVIAFWYLALKSQDRQGLKEYIVGCLRYSIDGRNIVEDQGLVTIDLMDRIDAEANKDEAAPQFDGVDGAITVTNRLVGYILLTTQTALRTGKSLVTIRRATGTGTWLIHESANRSSTSERDIRITMEGSEQDYVCVFPDDTDGRTYGRVVIPRPDSILSLHGVLLLPNDDSVTRAVQSFDRTSALDSHKAGVIYIGEKQSHEQDILRNLQGSPDYVDFIQSLGSLVKLKGATFNSQGLDLVDDADGQHAVVWHNKLTELVFHVTTFMPNDEDLNLNTANKKRHIGNNHVNIVFNNSGAAFDFDTFPSQFNSVYIVIAPSARTSFLQTRNLETTTENADRFYTVRVLTRPGYPAISSAAEEKVISGASLPGYVRNLALNECVFSLMWQQDETGEYPSSWRSRLHQLRRMWERYEP